MDCVLNVFFIGINFIKYYTVQIKIFTVKFEQQRLKNVKMDT